MDFLKKLHLTIMPQSNIFWIGYHINEVQLLLQSLKIPEDYCDGKFYDILLKYLWRPDY